MRSKLKILFLIVCLLASTPMGASSFPESFKRLKEIAMSAGKDETSWRLGIEYYKWERQVNLTNGDVIFYRVAYSVTVKGIAFYIVIKDHVEFRISGDRMETAKFYAYLGWTPGLSDKEIREIEKETGYSLRPGVKEDRYLYRKYIKGKFTHEFLSQSMADKIALEFLDEIASHGFIKK